MDSIPPFVQAIYRANERVLYLLGNHKFLRGLSGTPRVDWQVECSRDEVVGIERDLLLEDRGVGTGWSKLTGNNPVRRFGAKWGQQAGEHHILESKIQAKHMAQVYTMIEKFVDSNDEDFYVDIGNLASQQIAQIYHYFLYDSVSPLAEILVDIWEHGCLGLGWIGTWPTPGHPLVIAEIDPAHRLP